jgi:hypothetical protein
MKPNPGYCPAEAVGKNVVVRIVGDPHGKRLRVWPANPPTKWGRTGTPATIAEWDFADDSSGDGLAAVPLPASDHHSEENHA